MTLYTIKEVAQMLKINEQTLHRWVRDGKIETTRVANLHRISQEQLDKFLSQEKKK